MLWCDGLKQSTSTNCRRKGQISPESDLEHGSEEEDAGPSKHKKKDDKVANLIADL